MIENHSSATLNHWVESSSLSGVTRKSSSYSDVIAFLFFIAHDLHTARPLLCTHLSICCVGCPSYNPLIPYFLSFARIFYRTIF